MRIKHSEAAHGDEALRYFLQRGYKMAKVVPLFSGSSGNSYYISSGGSGILIDAGRSAKQLTAALAQNDIDIKSIEAIFITHEHSDHVKGLRVFANKHKLPVFASSGTIDELYRIGAADASTRLYVIGSEGVDLSTMHVDRFPISHDCAEGIGFRADLGGRSFALATDLGFISEEVEASLMGCNAVVIESNHDLRLLQMGKYPYYLKRRIMSDKGHLSNTVCSEFLPKLVKGGTTRFILAHLSRENNMPEIAYQESINELNANQMSLMNDFTLNVAPVETQGESVIF